MSKNQKIYILRDIPKDIFNDIPVIIMFDIRFQGLRIEPTLSASRELIEEGKDLYDVLEILKEGYTSSASKRKPNIIEKSIKKGNKEYKAVVAKTEIIYPDNFKEEVWRLIHFGKITYKKERRR